ncbi:MAG: DEAD/DEAH box helicase [Rhodospirillales bacterium]|nr:DEAD/DEAH box helicase [Rhodospirillales bacterium]
MSFSDLGLSDLVLNAARDAGYTVPTPIQVQAIPIVLMGRDVLGSAQTGTGKTAAFVLPMIDILSQGKAKARMPRTLILEPTRELAAQVAENFVIYGKYTKLSKALLIGGESLDDQIRVIERGADVLIATPGRLLDLFERGRLLLNDVKILVIDEADRMLDMGFMPDVEKIVNLLPRMRQTLFFSATMPPEIRRLADKFLMNPKEISVSPPATAAETVTQGLIVVAHGDGRRPSAGISEKRAMLRALIKSENVRNALIFCNRKRDVAVVYRSLQRHGLNVGQLHGDMSQPARNEMLARFKAGEVTLLVCSDVAARGLDIEDMSHVFNFDVPIHAEDYIHRIGRTGRAGREGRALTIAVPEDAYHINAIEALVGKPIPRLAVEGLANAQLAADDGARPAGRGGRPAHGRGPGRGGQGRGGHGRGDRQRPGPERAVHQVSGRAAESPRAINAAPLPERQTEPPAPRQAISAPPPPSPSPSPRPDRGASTDARGVKPARAMHASTPERERRPNPHRPDDHRPGEHRSVKGLGDHVPAFLRKG